jgi:elongation factor P
MYYLTSDFRKGLKIEYKGEPYIMVDFLHVKPGKGGAFVRTKLKNLFTGNVLEETFRSGEKLRIPDLDEKQMQYLYESEGNFCFMDTESFEQYFLTEKQLGEALGFLKENVIVKVLLYSKNPIAVEMPNFVDLIVVKTDPGVKGDTASGGTKPATLETGAVIQVPLFINEGDFIKIDTRKGEYIERVSR